METGWHFRQRLKRESAVRRPQTIKAEKQNGIGVFAPGDGENSE